MFYEINETIKEIDLEAINDDHLTVGIIPFSQLDVILSTFNFSESTKQACLSHNRRIQNSVSIYDRYTFGLMQIINLHQVEQSYDKIAFYIQSNLFLIVDIQDNDQSTKAALMNVLERVPATQLNLERVIYYFLNHLIVDNDVLFEEIEMKIEELEKRALAGDIKFLSEDITIIRKELLNLHNYYEHLGTMGNRLVENENGFFEENRLRYLQLFIQRVQRLSDSTTVLRELVQQVSDIYISQINLNMNKTMKVLTLINIIFLPLMLIVGWYGMNFKHMPELNFRYGYLGVIVLSISVVIGCVLWFKKKRFF